MLEKELAQATAMAEKANKKVEQLRKKLVAESEKSHARVKRELSAARKKHSVANDRLKKARGTLRQKASPGNQQKVESLKAQVQELGEALAKISKAAYEAADRYLSVKTDALLEARKASAADKAAKLVEQAAARADKKKAAQEISQHRFHSLRLHDPNVGCTCPACRKGAAQPDQAYGTERLAGGGMDPLPGFGVLALAGCCVSGLTPRMQQRVRLSPAPHKRIFQSNPS